MPSSIAHPKKGDAFAEILPREYKEKVERLQGERTMGFFAGELEVVLQEHNPLPNETPWNVLNRLNVHPQQTERLQKAADDIGQVATLPLPLLMQLKQELNLSPISWARLQAGVEADAFFRLLMYHNYPLEEAVNKANAVFASVLKDKLAVGANSDSIYPSLPELDALAAVPSPVRRRGRMRKADKEALLARQAQEREAAAQAAMQHEDGGEEAMAHIPEPQRKRGRGN